MDKLQSNNFVSTFSSLPRGGTITPETYLVKVTLTNGKSVLGLTSNSNNYTNYGDPELGAMADVIIDDGMGGYKSTRAKVSAVLGEVSAGALDQYTSILISINNKSSNQAIDFSVNQLLAQLAKHCDGNGDKLISPDEAKADNPVLTNIDSDIDEIKRIIGDFQYGTASNFQSATYTFQGDTLWINAVYPSGRASQQGECSTLMNEAYNQLMKKHPEWTVLRTAGNDPEYFTPQTGSVHAFLLVNTSGIPNPADGELTGRAITDYLSYEKESWLLVDPSFGRVVPLIDSGYDVTSVFSESRPVGYRRDLFASPSHKVSVPISIKDNTLYFIDISALGDSRFSLEFKSRQQGQSNSTVIPSSQYTDEMKAIATRFQAMTPGQIPTPEQRNEWTEIVR